MGLVGLLLAIALVVFIRLWPEKYQMLERKRWTAVGLNAPDPFPQARVSPRVLRIVIAIAAICSAIAIISWILDVL